MRKIICLAVAVLMIGLIGCAGSKVAITPSNVATLKGTWEGTLAFGEFEAQTAPAKLEILNDTLPLRGKLTATIPQIVASIFGAQAGTQVAENNNGKLSNRGTIVWAAEDASKASFEITLMGEKNLNAFFFFKGMRGDGNFTKK
jgi:hypothetical protein